MKFLLMILEQMEPTFPELKDMSSTKPKKFCKHFVEIHQHFTRWEINSAALLSNKSYISLNEFIFLFSAERTGESLCPSSPGNLY